MKRASIFQLMDVPNKIFLKGLWLSIKVHFAEYFKGCNWT